MVLSIHTEINMGLWRSFLPLEFLQKNNNTRLHVLFTANTESILIILRQVLATKHLLYYSSYIYVHSFINPNAR